jgi:hypothetical protein
LIITGTIWFQYSNAALESVLGGPFVRNDKILDHPQWSMGIIISFEEVSEVHTVTHHGVLAIGGGGGGGVKAISVCRTGV